DKLRFKHIVIDEGQDLTALEISVLADLSGHDSFTIVGDVSQSILPGRGLTDWKQTAGACFKGKVHTATLTMSYRTTSEIVNFSNSVLGSKHFSGALAKPVLRSGELPRLLRVATSEEQAKTIITIIGQTQSRGHKNIAIIARSVAEAQSLFVALKAQGATVSLLQDGSDEYEGGVQVLPVYLSKGLEFDAVILTDAGGDHYPDRELDAKLLYVALTRAMHELYVLYFGKISPLLRTVHKDLYQPNM
ncbi:MAG: 3'-5' exonuclease, partial [Bacillota bacterium]|nr:3'-5' exonuclease [Bacillota bacterium]